MPKIKRTYDVFLSYPFDLAVQAEVIVKKFAEEGLVVFTPSEVKKGMNVAEETWQALAESWAVVALVKPGSIPPSVAVEIGAASAWQKPVYILTEGEGEYQVPMYFSKYEVFRTIETEKVIKLISKALNPLSAKDLEVLKKTYAKLGIPTDQLFRQPVSLERLCNLLWKKLGIRISGERIMQELLRLRKKGKLPTVRRGNSETLNQRR